MQGVDNSVVTYKDRGVAIPAVISARGCPKADARLRNLWLQPQPCSITHRLGAVRAHMGLTEANRSDTCIAVQSSPGTLLLHPRMHQANNHDEEVLTFSRRGLAITQHLQDASEPQHPIGSPMSVDLLL